MNFNIILKELRKAANLTQEQLSVKLGCSAGAIGLYEQGRRKPDDETLISLAKIFNVSIDYLLGFEHPNFLLDKTSLNDIDFAMLNGIKKLSEKDKQNVMNIINSLSNNK